MASAADIAPFSLTPDEETAVKEILGYLNFSSGAGDPRFARNLDRLHGWLVLVDGQPRLKKILEERLSALADGSIAFKDCRQGRAVISMAFKDVLPAYRGHHADLLFHLAPQEFYQSFFVARVFEAVLAQGPNWNERERII